MDETKPVTKNEDGTYSVAVKMTPQSIQQQIDFATAQIAQENKNRDESIARYQKTIDINRAILDKMNAVA